MKNNNEEFLGYWFEYRRYICFPQTPNFTRKIGNFLLHSKVADENHKNSYDFYYRYVGNDAQLKLKFESVITTKSQYKNHYGAVQVINIDGKEFLFYSTVNFSKNKEPKNCYCKDFIRHVEYMFAGSSYYKKGYTLGQDFNEFVKLLEKDGKNFRKIRNKHFKEKFGKTIEEYIAEREEEKEFQKSVIYSTLVGEAYCTLERLRDECNAIMKGLQDGRHGYDLDRYKAFKNEIMAYNKYLGYKNEFIKGQVKKGSIRQQTLIMFLRDNAKKPNKKNKN